MLASVVIACYKHEQYLEECLETVYQQTFSDIRTRHRGRPFAGQEL